MKVSVAVITDKQNRVLITKRPLDKPQGGLWEFPGGKVEQDETPADALAREIKEELGLTVLKSKSLATLSHNYTSHAVTLYVFHVFQYQGVAAPLESQPDLAWVALEELNAYQFPEANTALINQIGSIIPALARMNE